MIKKLLELTPVKVPLILVLLLFLGQKSFAQIKMVGKVLDQDGEPLIGVNIISKNTPSKGTATDVNGVFEISLPEDDSMIFSYTGYEDQVVKVDKKLKWIIRMKENSETLDDIVVVGYGVTRKKDLIGSVDKISAKQIEKVSVASFDQALAGQAAGVQIRQGSGQPGAGAEILIRGISSISGGNQPLIVIDGLPYGNYNDQTDNFLTLIDPNDIESISIIRDASGKAIYGSRAANGLIIVKTKRGRAGKPIISFSGYTAVQTIPSWEKPEILNATELAQFLRERIEDQALVDGVDPVIPSTLEDPSIYGEGTNWWEALTRPGWMQSTDLSVRGGADNIKYFLGMGFLNQDGTTIESNLKRYSLRANLDADINRWLHIGFSFAPSWTNRVGGNNDPGGGQFSVYNTLNVARWADPTAPLYDANGNLTPTTKGTLLPFFQANPLFRLKEESVDRDNRQLLSSINLKVDLMPWLNFKTYAGIIHINNASRAFSPGSVVGTGLTPDSSDPQSNSFASSNRYENLRLVSENTLNFNKNIDKEGKHNLTGLIGYSAEKSIETTFSGSGTRLIDENFEFFNSGNVVTSLEQDPDQTRIFFGAREGRSEQALISYFGKISYKYESKYYITLATRTDGSSRFGPNNRYANFPSIGLAYRISNEPWFPKSDFLSNLRFEGSWGKNGNNRIGNYAWQGGISANAGYILGGGQAIGANLGSIRNPNLSWEETTQIDIGVDIGLMKNKVKIELDYFVQQTEDLIYNVPLPRVTGFGNYISNLGLIENRGLELSINAQPIVRDKFVWNIRANASANRNKVEKLGVDDIPIRRTFAGNGTPISWTQVGGPVGQYYGLEILGLYTPEMIDDPEIPKYAGAVAGAPYYRDGDGDGKLEAFDDYVFLGDPWPDFVYGITNTFTYGDFNLRIVAAGEVGGKIFDLQREFMLNTDGVFNVRRDVLDRWRPGSEDYTLRVPTTTSVNSSQRYRWPNSVGVVDGTYLKINNITLTYNLSTLLAKQKVIQSGSVYFSVQNAFVFSEFRGNPEVRRSRVGSLERNVNYGSYPVPRTFTLGFNLKL